MTTETQLHFSKDPAFTEAMFDIQEERWEDGLAKLDSLLEKFPFEKEIRVFRQEVLIKSQIDQYEVEEIEMARLRLVRKRLTQILGIVLFITIIYLGSTTYAGVITGITNRQIEAISDNVEDISLAIKFRNGQNLLSSGRAEEALIIFEEIAAENPEYENIDLFIAEAQGVLTIDGQYEQALTLISQDQWSQALEILTTIQDENPNYKDVGIKIEQVKRSINLGNLLIEANLAFDSANWSEAVIRYEAIRLSDSTFDALFVEDRLFNSYVNAAASVLENPEADAEELAQAETLFNKALALRPQDEDVYRIRKRVQDTIRGKIVDRYINEAQGALVDQEDSVAALERASFYLNKARDLDPANSQIALQSELANRFLAALENFRTLSWSQVISNLEYVYSFDQDYASGTARQTLYDSYIIRGDAYLAAGDFELALDDFRRAVELAKEMGEASILSVYEGELKVAFTLGLLADYEGAVLMYQTAISTGDIRALVAGSDPAFLRSLDAANAEALRGDFRVSYIRYRDLFDQQLVYSEFVTYIVKEGDYLSQIARQFRSSVQAIVKANEITDPNRINAGDELIIPILPEQ